MKKIATLGAASELLLEASEHLDRAGAGLLAQAVRDLAESVFVATREAIVGALSEPGDAWERRDLLNAALRLDGVASPLAAKAARCLAEGAAEAASALAAAA